MRRLHTALGAAALLLSLASGNVQAQFGSITQCIGMDEPEKTQCKKLAEINDKLDEMKRETEMREFKDSQFRDCLIFWSARDCNWIAPR